MMIISIPDAGLTHHHRGRQPLVGLKMQSDANTKLNSFSSLLNFKSNESHAQRSGPEVKNGRSGSEDDAPERLRCGIVKEEVS